MTNKTVSQIADELVTKTHGGVSLVKKPAPAPAPAPAPRPISAPKGTSSTGSSSKGYPSGYVTYKDRMAAKQAASGEKKWDGYGRPPYTMANIDAAKMEAALAKVGPDTYMVDFVGQIGLTWPIYLHHDTEIFEFVRDALGEARRKAQAKSQK